MKFLRTSLALLMVAACQLTPGVLKAQEVTPLPDNHQLSIGASAGIADLWGDVGTSHFSDHWGSSYYWRDLRFMGSLHLKYSITPYLALRLGAGYGALYASDQFNKKLYSQDPDPSKLHTQLYFRNMDVKTNIAEANLVFEINPLRALRLSSRAAHWGMQPILLFGVGVYHFDPYGTYTEPNGAQRWVRLQPLHTEGQTFTGPGTAGNEQEDYKLTQVNMPIGGGLRWQLGEQWAVSVEYLFRYCFTDYLDDVSNSYIDPALFNQYLSPQDAVVARQMHDKTSLIQPNATHPAGDIRGNPNNKDGYSTFGVTVFYTFLNKDYGHALFRRNGRVKKYGDRLW